MVNNNSRHPKLSWIFKIALLTVSITLFLYWYLYSKSSHSIVYKKNTSPAPSGLEFVRVGKSLKETVESSMVKTKGIYGIYIKNLKTGETYASNENKKFNAGSLYKLWVMATTYKKIQEGELKEEDELSEAIPDLNSKFGITPESAEQTSGIITLTVGSALKQMISISHNYAALLLIEKVKSSQVTAFLNQNSYKNSEIGTEKSPPITTPSDISVFLNKLYEGEIINKQYSDKMITLLKGQKINDKIPKYLPKDLEVAHKTGEIDYFSHDAGIIFSKNGDYIIVVLSESDSPPGAEDRIAQLSRAVYDYFNNY